MTIADTLIILSSLCGPLFAIQVTRYLDDKKEAQGRKLILFKTLMATRSYTLSAKHIEALNQIDLEFSGNGVNDKRVIEVWREYLDLLGDKSLSPEQWGLKRMDLLVDLLYEMGRALGYQFDKTHIKNASYAPIAHERIEGEQQAIRTQILEILNGKNELPIRVIRSPPEG